MLVEFSLELVYSTMIGKIFNYGVLIPENALNLGILTHVPLPT